jgi:hypothetical protein
LAFKILPKFFQHLGGFFDAVYRRDCFALDDSYCSGKRVRALAVCEVLTAKDCGAPDSANFSARIITHQNARLRAAGMQPLWCTA